MDGAYSRYGGEYRCIQCFCEKTWRKRPIGRHRRRWDDNITIDLQEVGCGVMDWTDLDQDRDGLRAVVNAVMKFRFDTMRGIYLLA
jgi:hypothetical protein